MAQSLTSGLWNQLDPSQDGLYHFLIGDLGLSALIFGSANSTI